MDNIEFWAGTETSWDAYNEALAKANAMVAEKGAPKADMLEEDEELCKQYYQRAGNIAIINLSGSLVSGSAGYGLYFGYIGYDDIRGLVARALGDYEVQGILYVWGSGGGHVAGCSDTASMIRRASTIKPSVSYNGSQMCSAALWAGSATGYVVTGRTAVNGSLGILSIHLDRTKYLEEMGIKPTVVRGGKYKALANPYEPLSAEALAEMEKQAAQLYTIFKEDVATNFGMTASAVESKFGQGRTFLGDEAKSLGLAQAVGSLEDAYAACVRKARRAASTNSGKVQAQASTTVAKVGDNSANLESTQMPTPFTDEQLAALAAGVDLSANTDPEDESSMDSAAKAAAEAAAAKAAAEAAEAAAKAEADAKAEAAKAAAPTLTQVLDSLVAAKTEAAAAKAEATALQGKLTELETVKTAQDESLAKAMAIVAASVQSMGLHFGVNKDSVAAMSHSELLAEHGRLADLFKQKFKAGSLAAVSGTPSGTAPAKVAVNPIFVSAVNKT